MLSPVVSFLITSAFGNPMPALARLPFMVAELAVFAAVSGMFSEKIVKNAWLAFPAVLLAQVAGRGTCYAFGFDFSVRNTFYARRYMVADSDGAPRNSFASRNRTVYRNGLTFDFD